MYQNPKNLEVYCCLLLIFSLYATINIAYFDNSKRNNNNVNDPFVFGNKKIMIHSFWIYSNMWNNCYCKDCIFQQFKIIQRLNNFIILFVKFYISNYVNFILNVSLRRIEKIVNAYFPLNDCFYYIISYID